MPEIAWPEAVSIYGSSDTAYALPSRDGNFKIRLLKDGTYSVHIVAASGLEIPLLLMLKFLMQALCLLVQLHYTNK